MFVVDVAGWQKAFKSARGPVGAYIKDRTGDVRVAVALEAPGPGKFPRNRTGINYGTGKLMNTISTSFYANGIDDVEGHVIAKPAYAKFLIHGTLPHPIFPKTPGGMLRFYWVKHAKWMVLPHVNHPGTAANDFMTRGLKRGLRAAGVI